MLLNMKKILYCLLILFLSVGSVFAEDLRFLQVTDVHLTPENREEFHNLIEEFNAMEDKYADFVVFSGDNIDSPREEDLQAFLDEVKRLKFKAYVVIGNHDVFVSDGLDKKLYMKKVRRELGFYHSAKPHYVFRKKDVVFIIVDGAKEVIPGPNGYFRDSELHWLEKKLQKYSAKKIVIIQHFPLLDYRVKGHITYKREKYLQLLENYPNVMSIVSGHFHENREERIGSTYHIATENFVGKGYYKIIEVSPENNMVYTFLARTGE